MKKISTILITTLLFWSCQSNELKPASTEEKTITEGISLQNNTLIFKDVKTFQSMTSSIMENPTKMENFKNRLKTSGFFSLEDYYNNVSEEDLASVFKTKVVPSHLEKYFTLVKENGDLELSYTVPELFLRIIANEKMSWIIGNDRYSLKGDKLLIEEKYATSQAILKEMKINRSNSTPANARPNGTLDTSNEITYTSVVDGNTYKLKVKAQTSSVAWGCNCGPLWQFVGFEAIHYKRNLGIFWHKDTGEIQIQGTARLIPNTGNSLTNTDITRPVLYHTHIAGTGAGNVKSYNVTAYCKGANGNYYWVSTSASL